jgi:hypothetical protein
MEHRHFCSETSQLAMNYISAPLRSVYRTMEIKNRVSFNILHVTFEDPKNIDPIVGYLDNIKNMTFISLYIVQGITKLQQI